MKFLILIILLPINLFAQLDDRVFHRASEEAWQRVQIKSIMHNNTFIADAFVVVHNLDHRKQLIEELTNVGYKFEPTNTNGCGFLVGNTYSTSPVLTQSLMPKGFALRYVDDGYIDCGDDVGLFLELAKMNRLNPQSLYFREYRYVKGLHKDHPGIAPYVRAEDVAEAYEDGDIPIPKW